MSVVKRIEEICKEFDARVIQVGLPIARLELAKALAEREAAQQTLGQVDAANRRCQECNALLEVSSVYCDTCGTDVPRLQPTRRKENHDT